MRSLVARTNPPTRPRFIKRRISGADGAEAERVARASAEFLSRVDHLCRVLVVQEEVGPGAEQIWTLASEVYAECPDLRVLARGLWTIWGALIDDLEFAHSDADRVAAQRRIQDVARAWLSVGGSSEDRAQFVDAWLEILT